MQNTQLSGCHIVNSQYMLANIIISDNLRENSFRHSKDYVENNKVEIGYLLQYWVSIK